MHTHSLFVFIPLPAPSCPRDRGVNKLRILICNNHKWFPLRLFRHFEAVWSVNVVSAVPYSSFSYCLMAAFIAVSCGHCKCTYSDVQSATPQKLIWRLSLMTDRGLSWEQLMMTFNRIDYKCYLVCVIEGFWFIAMRGKRLQIVFLYRKIDIFKIFKHWRLLRNLRIAISFCKREIFTILHSLCSFCFTPCHVYLLCSCR